jgi:hypothetical protein
MFGSCRVCGQIENFYQSSSIETRAGARKRKIFCTCMKDTIGIAGEKKEGTRNLIIRH